MIFSDCFPIQLDESGKFRGIGFRIFPVFRHFPRIGMQRFIDFLREFSEIFLGSLATEFRFLYRCRIARTFGDNLFVFFILRNNPSAFLGLNMGLARLWAGRIVLRKEAKNRLFRERRTLMLFPDRNRHSSRL